MSEAKSIDQLSLAEAEEALANTRKLRDEKAAEHDFDGAEHCMHLMNVLSQRIEDLRRL